jgi:hypothetical protein
MQAYSTSADALFEYATRPKDSFEAARTRHQGDTNLQQRAGPVLYSYSKQRTPSSSKCNGFIAGYMGLFMWIRPRKVTGVLHAHRDASV